MLAIGYSGFLAGIAEHLAAELNLPSDSGATAEYIAESLAEAFALQLCTCMDGPKPPVDPAEHHEFCPLVLAVAIFEGEED